MNPNIHGLILTDDADAIAQKVRKAKTDPEPLPSSPEGLEGRAEAQNTVGTYAALADVSVEAVLQEFGGRGFGDFKPALAELAVAQIITNGRKHARLLESPEDIDHILEDGGRGPGAGDCGTDYRLGERHSRLLGHK